MTPEREAAIRKIATRDGESWRSSKVVNLALRETLAEIDRLRGVAEVMRRGLAGGLADVPNPRNPAAAEAIRFVLDKGREIGLFKD